MVNGIDSLISLSDFLLLVYRNASDFCLLETYITICKIDSQQEFAVWLRKLKQGLCVNLEGWGGEEDGREVQKGGNICISVADLC